VTRVLLAEPRAARIVRALDDRVVAPLIGREDPPCLRRLRPDQRPHPAIDLSRQHVVLPVERPRVSIAALLTFPPYLFQPEHRFHVPVHLPAPGVRDALYDGRMSTARAARSGSRPKSRQNRRGRTLVLAGELAALIERRWQARLLTDDEGTTRMVPLVFHRDGEPVGDFRKGWATACEAAGLQGRLFHRTSIRNVVQAGVPARVAMEVSGYKTHSVFDRYNILSEQDIRAAVERTSDYLNRLPVEPTVVPLARAVGQTGVARVRRVRTQDVHKHTKGVSH